MNDPYGLLASGLPPEMAAKAMGLTRQQMVMQALLQQSQQGMQAPEVKGRFQGRISPLEGIAKIAQAFVAQKGMQDADKGRSELYSQKQQAVSDALMQYEQRKAGTPEIQQPPEDLGGGPGRPAIPGDRRAAVASALVNPLLAGNPLVMGDAKGIAKEAEPFSLRPGEQRVAGGQVVAQAPHKPGEHVIDGKVFTTTPQGVKDLGGPGVRADPNKPFMPDGTPNAAFQQYEKDKAKSGATKVETQVNAFTPASEEAQKRFMDSSRTTYDQLKQAPVALESIEKAKALVPQAGGFVGSGGETKLAIAKFLNNNLGLSINEKGVEAGEELRTRVFFNIMDNLKKMDAQPSQLQQEMMREALGNLGTDPNALPKVLDAFADVIKGKVNLYNQEVAGAAARGVKFPYDPSIKMPDLSQQPQRRSSDKPGAVLKFDEHGNQR